MATNHTQNYQLNLWEAQDTFLRTEFNENSQKIDAALKAEADARAAGDAALQTAVAAKADASTVTALTQTVNGKADTSTVTALTQTVAGKADAATVTALTQTVNGKADKSALNALTQTVAGKGNCTILFGSYTGTGTYGKDSPTSLDFAATMGKAPLLIYISALGSGEYHMLAARDVKTHAYAPNISSIYYRTLSWTETGLQWYSSNSADTQLNHSGSAYCYCALFD